MFIGILMADSSYPTGTWAKNIRYWSEKVLMPMHVELPYVSQHMTRKVPIEDRAEKYNKWVAPGLIRYRKWLSRESEKLRVRKP